MDNKSLTTIAGLPPMQFAAKSEDLKDWLKSFESAAKDTEVLQTDAVNHYIEEGVYGRELTIPKDTLIVSRVHKTGSINTISKGKVIIYDTFGRHEKEAPCTFTSPKGTHRIVYAVEDTVWTGVHHSEETDVETIFEDLTVETYEEFLQYIDGGKQLCG